MGQILYAFLSVQSESVHLKNIAFWSLKSTTPKSSPHPGQRIMLTGCSSLVIQQIPSEHLQCGQATVANNWVSALSWCEMRNKVLIRPLIWEKICAYMSHTRRNFFHGKAYKWCLRWLRPHTRPSIKYNSSLRSLGQKAKSKDIWRQVMAGCPPSHYCQHHHHHLIMELWYYGLESET